MTLGYPQIAQVGSITAPSSVQISFGSAIGSTLKGYGLYTAIPLPSLKSVMICHGVEAMRHILSGSSYRIGILAPRAGQTVASTATRATSTLTITTNPSDGDRIQVGKQPDGTFSEYIYFKSTLNTTTYTSAQVQIGATKAITATNLIKLIQGTGTNGSEYYDADQIYRNGVYDPEYWHDRHGIEISASNTGATNPTVTFRTIIGGVSLGNYLSHVDVGGVRIAFSDDPFMAGGAAGTGTAPSAGEYTYAYQHMRQGDGALSGRSATSVLITGDNSNVNQTDFVDASARFGETHFRQLRSTTGGVDLWKVQDTTIATGEPYVDSLPDGVEDDALALVGRGAVPYEDTIYRLYAGGCPTIARCVALYKGSVWIGGCHRAADITTGTVSITAQTYALTFSAARVCKEQIIGRTIVIAGDTNEYLIVDVDESSGVAQLNIPWQGSTASGASYTLSDKRNPFALYWSEPLLPNNWPVGNHLDDITSLDPVGITGLKTAWDSLVAWTKTGVWRVYGDQSSGFRLQHVGEGMGCYSPHAVVDVEGTLFWLGRDGIFMWDGAGDPQLLSKPVSPLGQFPKGIQRTLARINQDEADMIVSAYNPSTRVILWACPMDGETHNNDAIVYDTQSGAFTEDIVPSLTYLAAVPGSDGSHVTLGGGAFGSIYQMEVSGCTSDGAFGFEPVQTFSSYAAATLTATVGSSVLPTASNGLKGIPVLHVSALGDIQWNLIKSNTSSTITTAYPWVSDPSNGTLIVGGIWLDVLTAQYDFSSPNAFKWIDRTIISFVPQTLGRLYLAHGINGSDPFLFHNRTLGGTDYADLSSDRGQKDFPARSDRAYRLSQRFVALAPGFDVTILSFETRLGMNEPLNAGA